MYRHLGDKSFGRETFTRQALGRHGWSSLKTGPARPGHAKIALDITAVEFDQFSLYSTGTMIMYNKLSL